MRAVPVSSIGGTDVLQATDVDRPSLDPGQLLVQVSVAGVNDMDVYQRTGGTPLPLPFVAEVEGVGTVVERVSIGRPLLPRRREERARGARGAADHRHAAAAARGRRARRLTLSCASGSRASAGGAGWEKPGATCLMPQP